jgi:hypothetical protein
VTGYLKRRHPHNKHLQLLPPLSRVFLLNFSKDRKNKTARRRMLLTKLLMLLGQATKTKRRRKRQSNGRQAMI